MRKRENKKGQVWIETVLYTLIGLALMGIALGFIMPKINQTRDKLLVEQAITSLSVLDDKIIETLEGAPGSTRKTEFSMKKGELVFDAVNDEITFSLTGLSSAFSEPGMEARSGRIIVNTTQGQKNYNIVLKIRYNADITYDNANEAKKINAAPTPYVFITENKGVQNDRDVIDVREISK